MAIFRFFEDGGRPPPWICYVCIWTTHEGHLVVFVALQNLVGIDAVVLIICMFCDWETPIHAPKIGVLGGFYPLTGKHINETSKRHILGQKDVV